MLYQFKCKSCDHDQEEMFLASEYDLKVQDGLLIDTQCENCGTKSLIRNITTIPSILGGTKGYVSVERYLSKNPDQRRRKEQELTEKLTQRHKERVADRIDKHKTRRKAPRRGQGYKEDKTSID